jgi:putative oxidoreductase
MKSFWLLFRKIVTSEYLAFVLRMYIGIIFLYAAMTKITYPAEFAEALAAYQIVPYWALNFVAIYLPCVELTCGLFLVIGLSTRSASAVVIFLLIIFSIGQTINLIGRIPIDCGCFQNAGDQITWWDIPKDLGWMLLTLQIFFFDRIFRLYPDLSISGFTRRP